MKQCERALGIHRIQLIFFITERPTIKSRKEKRQPIQRIELYLHLENAFVYIMCSNCLFGHVGQTYGGVVSCRA